MAAVSGVRHQSAIGYLCYDTHNKLIAAIHRYPAQRAALQRGVAVLQQLSLWVTMRSVAADTAIRCERRLSLIRNEVSPFAP